MKKNKISILVTATLALIAGASVPFLLSNEQLDEHQRHSIKSEVPYMVTSPEVP